MISVLPCQPAISDRQRRVLGAFDCRPVSAREERQSQPISEVVSSVFFRDS